MIRNLKWFGAMDNVADPLIGHPIQEALGLNVKNILEAACDKFDENYNAHYLLLTCTGDAGPIARELDEDLFHADGGI